MVNDIMKTDEIKILFIIKRRKDIYLTNCLDSIKNQKVSYCATIEYIVIDSDAFVSDNINSIIEKNRDKYIVYVDAYCCIVNDMFLDNIINIFKKHIDMGLITAIGMNSLPADANLLASNHWCGKLYVIQENDFKEQVYYNEENADYMQVRYLLPLLYATRPNIKWCEEYKNEYVSLLMMYELLRANHYKMAVTAQKNPWLALQIKNMELEINEEELNNYKNKNHTDECLYRFGNNTRFVDSHRFWCPEGIMIGDNVSIQKDAFFMLPYGNFAGKPRIKIGNGCDIGYRCIITAVNDITIEDKVLIANNVQIMDHNHAYEKIGVPIMDQGVVVKENGEVVVGYGSWLGNNVVIAGTVHIGRGCVIGANSVVTSDIPDYCVAVGSPAKIVKGFSYKTGKWCRLKNEEERIAFLKERKKSKPILTYAIITYNRAFYLEKALQCILSQVKNDNIIEVLVSDNGSTDETPMVVKKYKKAYPNLKYYRNDRNLGVEANIHNAINKSTGEYVIVAGDDDYLKEGKIYEIVNIIYNHRECAVFDIVNTHAKQQIFVGKGASQYVDKLGYLMTWITGVILKTQEYHALTDVHKFDGTEMPQVYFQLEILKNYKLFGIIYGEYLRTDSGEHKPNGYNFIKVFVENYLNILADNKMIDKDVMEKEKKNLLYNMILPWCRKIVHENINLSLDGIFEIMDKYYAGTTYWNTVKKELNGVIKKV